MLFYLVCADTFALVFCLLFLQNKAQRSSGQSGIGRKWKNIFNI